MPLSVKKMGDKYRVVGPNGKPETNKKGMPVDGGGFDTKQAAIKQMTAINISKTSAIELLVANKIDNALTTKVTE